MATGFSAANANAIVDGFDTGWVQLHTADPGAAGTTAIASETDRQQLSLATASGGVASSDAALTWTSITGSQDATHYSLWSASTAGTFWHSGSITADAYVAGNTFTIGSGDLTITVPIATGA